jgi:hypothetical protein
MIIDRMITHLGIDTSGMSQDQWKEIDIKLASIEEHLRMKYILNSTHDQVECSEEISNIKPKPYYRKGRWD